jgi:hypothetical protein
MQDWMELRAHPLGASRTLRRDPAEAVPRAKVQRRSPEILSGSEVKGQSVAGGAGAAAASEEIQRLVPGIGETATVRIEPDGWSVGHMLEDLDLRAGLESAERA